MTPARQYFTFLTCAAMIHLYNADSLPPPTSLSHLWLDKHTVELSWDWQRPSNLSADSTILFELTGMAFPRRTPSKTFKVSWLTEERESNECVYSVHTVCESCGWSPSTSVNITVTGRKQWEKLVEDFRCLLDSRGMNCSWIPADPSVNLMVSSRHCNTGTKAEGEQSQIYSSGKRKGLFMKYEGLAICFLVDTEYEWNYFEPPLEILPPKLNITEDKGHLRLNWVPPGVGENCKWLYTFNYTQCNKPMEPRDYTQNKMSPGYAPPSIVYDENCRYEFQYTVKTDSSCPKIISTWSEVVTYGTNKTRDGTMTVVAIVIPIILFVCVLLSCYCFRKHRDIICPDIPDPSAIFKEMMMNGNKDSKPMAGNLYTPVPESVESGQITLVCEHSVPQQNS